MTNHILTTHLGNASMKIRNAIAEIAANNIISVLEGKRALNCASPQVYEP